MKVTIYQDANSYSFELTNIEKDNLSVLVGTALKRFFQFAMVCKSVNVKSFKFSEPIGLIVANEFDVPLFDSFDNERFKTGLKLQRTKSGLKRFAVRTLEVIEFALSDMEQSSVEELEDE